MNNQEWTIKDLLKIAAYTLLVGFLVGFVVGYETGYNPAPLPVFKPIVG